MSEFPYFVAVFVAVSIAWFTFGVAVGVAVKLVEIKRTQGRVAELEDLLRMADEELYAPSPNCSCHMAPPCGDCVKYSGLRDLKRSIKRVLDGAV